MLECLFIGERANRWTTETHSIFPLLDVTANSLIPDLLKLRHISQKRSRHL